MQTDPNPALITARALVSVLEMTEASILQEMKGQPAAEKADLWDKRRIISNSLIDARDVVELLEGI